jgi:hypothetical protein
MLALLLAIDLATRLDQESALEQRLENLRGSVMLKLDKLRSAKQTPTRQQFQEELRDLDALVASALKSDPDTYTAALMFEANLLAAKLGETDEAIKCYDLVLARKDLDFTVRSHTLIEKATLLRREHRLEALETLVKNYAATADADEGLRDHLAGILRRARLVAGSRFPELQIADLDGKPASVPSKSGRPQVLAFLRLRGTLEVKGRTQEDLEQAAQLAAAVKESGSADLLVVSVDLDLHALTEVVRRAQAKYPVVWQEPTDPKSLGAVCGIQETPAIFLLSADGKIVSEHNSAADAIAAIKRLGGSRAGG